MSLLLSSTDYNLALFPIIWIQVFNALLTLIGQLVQPAGTTRGKIVCPVCVLRMCCVSVDVASVMLLFLGYDSNDAGMFGGVLIAAGDSIQSVSQPAS